MRKRRDGRPGKGGHHNGPAAQSDSTAGARSRDRLPWLKVYVTDTLAETQGWTNAAVGACARLCAVQWMRGSLPADPEALRVLVNASVEEWSITWSLIGYLFPRRGSGRQHLQLEDERRDAQARHARQRAASQTANRARWAPDGGADNA